MGNCLSGGEPQRSGRNGGGGKTKVRTHMLFPPRNSGGASPRSSPQTPRKL